MYRVDHPTGALTLPPPTAPTATPNRYYFAGNEATAIPATVVEDEHLNMITEEMCNVVLGAGLQLRKDQRNQLWQGITEWTLGQIPNPQAVWDSVGRNYMHNTMFRVWQRGNGPFNVAGNTETYTADEWLAVATTPSTGAVVVWANDASNAAEIGMDVAFPTALNFAFAGAANSYCLLQHRIEDVTITGNKRMCLSFWAKAATAPFTLGVSISQVFTGTVPNRELPAQTVMLTNTYQRYHFIFDVPSALTGYPNIYTPGGTSNHYSQVNFWCSASGITAALAGNIGVQSGSFVLWGTQFEEADEPTPLEKRGSMGTDLAISQRYFQRGYIYQVFNSPGPGESIGVGIPYTVPMRQLATVTANWATTENFATLQIVPFPLILSINSGWWGVNAFGTTAAAGRAIMYGHWSASAEL